jgi:DNA-directed RNA polymerase subunit K/omega
MVGTRDKLVEEGLSKNDSRYLVCSVVSKRAKQIGRHKDSQGVAWAINQALRELNDGKINYDLPVLEKLQAKKSRANKASR